MSVQHYYSLCQRYKGRAVEIVTKDGKMYRGVIQHVDYEKVYLRTAGHSHLGGFGYGYWGPGWGYGGSGLGLGIALGAIGGLALAPWFFI